MTDIVLPEAFRDLFTPKRYKVYYGGRGGAKSHNIARALLILGMQKKCRIVCAREIQKSVDDSVKQLLADIIAEYNLEYFYTVQDKVIRGKNGTQFKFRGLKHNTTDMKSLEGANYLWVEEAENVSARSWEIVIPTIRAPNSEIWISFNPKHPTDPTYNDFVANADDDMIVRKVSYRDNPFFPDILEKERVKLKARSLDAYNHVWEGDFDKRHFGGIYATWVDEAREQKRICPVPHTVGLPVFTAWDLGKSDSTCIWFFQVVGLQARVINYYEESGKELGHYADVIREKRDKLKYSYGKHYVPHDAGHERLGMSGSISNQLKTLGVPNTVIKVGSVAYRIELGRKLLGQCFIDKDKCKDGIHALTNYQYQYDEDKERFKDKPRHDWASDGADAFGYMAQAVNMQLRIEESAHRSGTIKNKASGLSMRGVR